MNAIDYFSFGHPLTGIRSHFALRARIKMYNLFMHVMRPSRTTSIIDLGVTPDESLPESNLFEKLYPYKHKIIAVSIEDANFLEKKYNGLQFLKINKGDKLPFKDDQFDILYCSAVIEHVGNTDSQRTFITEALRVSKRFFITTPNRYFPLEIHTMIPFLHWLPKPYYQTILIQLGLDFWANTENLNLLTPSLFKKIFPYNTDITITHNRLLGLPANIIIYGKKQST
jgi:SAM-dependent methyltransferase